MQQRYDIREEEDGMWTVFDIFTGLPAEVNGEILIGLDIQEADDAVDLMNAIDLKRRGEIE
ncbi:hypothetical protein [Roseibium alexandrii]|uniref:Uncharacterized protein n=1 Tax=Roseibium alexandrii TaxID=388408 RepID=A0A0M6ZWU1_9HYPH|nr:hypothetical protein [Roseibium alexandrii]CTQ67229.1 hypothetical protein LAX5112_01279 [Roseibium alexandrii]